MATIRADGPAGLMKVRSVSDLPGGRGWVGSGGIVPENPVTIASPKLRMGAPLGAWAFAA
jgi:hypothetical protein